MPESRTSVYLVQWRDLSDGSEKSDCVQAEGCVQAIDLIGAIHGRPSCTSADICLNIVSVSNLSTR